MNITDYADIINVNIKITYYHNQNYRWSACFEYADFLAHEGSVILRSEHGNGESPVEAINNYIDLIKGKILVFDAMSGDKRREYKVPMGLEYKA